MKVFISSVRRGLEDERDALPGLILAVGHEPLRFEDFSAQPVPSREACLRGVAEADVYLLLLGEVYGDPLPETGLSPTAEEFVAAKARGIPCLVFRKQGVSMEPEQAAFAAEVEAYSTGRFRDSFIGAIDLQPKVVAALRDLPSTGLRWRKLNSIPIVSWLSDWPAPRLASHGTMLEVHLLSEPKEQLSRRELRLLPDRLGERVRVLKVIAPSEGIDVGADAEAAWVLLARGPARGSWNEPDPGSVLGMRIQSDGQRSSWEVLPSDSMGTILDREDLQARLAARIRVLASLIPSSAPECSVAMGLETSGFTTVGSLRDLGRRSSASGFSTERVSFMLPPDEAVPSDAVERGAAEIAAPLVDEVLRQFQAHR